MSCEWAVPRLLAAWMSWRDSIQPGRDSVCIRPHLNSQQQSRYESGQAQSPIHSCNISPSQVLTTSISRYHTPLLVSQNSHHARAFYTSARVINATPRQYIELGKTCICLRWALRDTPCLSMLSCQASRYLRKAVGIASVWASITRRVTYAHSLRYHHCVFYSSEESVKDKVY